MQGQVPMHPSSDCPTEPGRIGMEYEGATAIFNVACRKQNKNRCTHSHIGWTMEASIKSKSRNQRKFKSPNL